MLGFGLGRIRTLVSMATDRSHRLTMGKKIFFSETTRPRAFILVYSGPLYKSCQTCPWGPYGPRPMGRHGKNINKSSTPKPQGPELSYFVCSNV